MGHLSIRTSRPIFVLKGQLSQIPSMKVYIFLYHTFYKTYRILLGQFRITILKGQSGAIILSHYAKSNVIETY